MAHVTHNALVDRDGARGRVLRTLHAGELGADGAPVREPHVLVQFADRRPVRVPMDLLETRPDGTLQLLVSHDELREDGTFVMPLAREELVVDKRSVERARLHLHKRVQAHEAEIDEPLLEEHLELERVEIGRYVDEAPPTVERDDGTLVIPCLQEVLVVEKRLLLKEELHVRRVQTTRRERHTVALREEVLEVERRPARQGQANRSSSAPEARRTS